MASENEQERPYLPPEAQLVFMEMAGILESLTNEAKAWLARLAPEERAELEQSLERALLRAHTEGQPRGETSRTHTPTKTYVPVDKLAQQLLGLHTTSAALYKTILAGDSAKVRMWGEVKNGTAVCANVSARGANDIDIKAVRGLPLTPFDAGVYRAVNDLYQTGNRIITPLMIARAMQHDTTKKGVSDKQIEDITSSMRACRDTVVRITSSPAEVGTYNGLQTVLEDNLLSIAIVENAVINNNETQIAYIVKSEPLLCMYSRIKGHMRTYNARILEMQGHVNRDKSALQAYLLNRYSYPQVKGELSEKIAYQAIYDIMGLSGTGVSAQKMKSKYRKWTAEILSSWKETGFISEYHEVKKNGAYATVVFTRTEKSGQPNKKKGQI